MSKSSLALALCLAGLGCMQNPGALGEAPPEAATFSTRSKLKGAGATFPHPIYSKWAFHYGRDTGVRLSYNQVGSGAGVLAAATGEVDFGATDIPLTDRQLEQDGLVQFPMVIGGVVPVVNLPGVEAGALVLSPTTLAGIFLGDISRWNSPEIRLENPAIDLPDQEITPIYRADASGSTWIFTSFLSQCCPEWQTRVGAGSNVAWPVGVGARGNQQVARFVGQFEFTIAYVEFAHANLSNLVWVALQVGGQTVTPSLLNFEKAAAASTWRTGTSVRLWPPEIADPSVWPIVGASYILVKKQPTSAVRMHKLFGFLHWAFTDGAPLARELSYAAVPEEHIATIEQMWRDQVRENGRAVWQP